MIDFKQKIEEEERKLKQNLSLEEDLLINNKKRRRFFTYLTAVIAIALVFSSRILISSPNAANWFPNINIFDKLRHLVPSSDNKLSGEDKDRINILLLGMGGAGHEGAYLTDTIILASFKPSTQQIALISIPRDLVSPVSNWQKINSINAYAEQKNPGKGGEITAQAMSALLQEPINYYVRVDFNGFSNIVDQLGGIRVKVEHTLDDYTYPISGQEDNPDYYARFQHLHIDKGWQNMNGSLALKYARSRHAYGIEGSDFARARRQQLVLEAIKDKLFSTRTLLNPVMISKLVKELNKNISTNLDAWKVVRLWTLFKNLKRSNIINKVLSDAPDNLLTAKINENGAYVLVPKTGNFSQIRRMVKDIFSSSSIKTINKPLLVNDDAKVLVLNGTWINGLAAKTALNLKQLKFQVIKVANAPQRNYKKTSIYDLTGNYKKRSLYILKNATKANVSQTAPKWIESYQNIISNRSTPSTPDFILLLGTDSNRAK